MESRLIAALRVLRGMTQRQLATDVGRSQTWVSFVESGKVIPRDKELQKLKTVLQWEAVPFRSEQGKKT